MTDEIRLGVGLLPLDRWPPARIAARIEELGLPRDRLVLGVGSGAGGGLDRVREGIGHLRRLLDVPVVGALGPKMCRLAGELADGVLLDWVTSSHARRSRDHAAAAAEDACRPAPDIAAYVFSALGAAAARKLQDEIDHYTTVPAYGSHFERISGPVERAIVSARTTEDMQRALQRFDAVVDETVVRAVTAGEEAAGYVRVLTAAAPNWGPTRG